MFCDECKQKAATVHLTQMINGKKFDTHLCNECAAKKGFLLFDTDNKFSIPNFLGTFLGSDFNLKEMHALPQDTKCSNCGVSFNEIRKTGKLGCSECYKAFERELEPTLRSIHGNNRHVGKIPIRSRGQVLVNKKIEKLKQNLQHAIAEENYEKAAEFRDKIKELEKEIH